MGIYHPQHGVTINGKRLYDDRKAYGQALAPNIYQLARFSPDWFTNNWGFVDGFGYGNSVYTYLSKDQQVFGAAANADYAAHHLFLFIPTQLLVGRKIRIVTDIFTGRNSMRRLLLRPDTTDIIVSSDPYDGPLSNSYYNQSVSGTGLFTVYFPSGGTFSSGTIGTTGKRLFEIISSYTLAGGIDTKIYQCQILNSDNTVFMDLLPTSFWTTDNSVIRNRSTGAVISTVQSNPSFYHNTSGLTNTAVAVPGGYVQTIYGKDLLFTN